MAHFQKRSVLPFGTDRKNTFSLAPPANAEMGFVVAVTTFEREERAEY